MGVFRKAVIAALSAAFALASPARASEDIKDMAKAVTSAAAARQVKRVAVVPFTAPRGAGSFSGAIVSERLVIQILARGELDLVERRFLDKVLEEQRLGVFGIMDQDTVKALGKVLGVDAILTGTIVELKGERVEINARLIHAETAQVLAADTVRVAKDWEERAIGEDASTWIVPVPDLGDEPFKSGASCQTSVDAVESRLLDFKARYWAERLKDLLEQFDDLRERVRAIEEVEHKGDTLTHEIIKKLNTSFITPIDREDILALASSLDDVIDLIEAAATRMLLFKVTEATPHAKELGFLILKCVQELHKGIVHLPSSKGRDHVYEHCVEVNSLENEADRVCRDAIAFLFEHEKDPITILKWKEIYETLETATDRCEDTANVLEGVALKNA